MTASHTEVPRVLHVVGAMDRGGAETMLMTLYRALNKSRLQFDFLEFVDRETHYAAEIRAMGGRIHRSEWSQDPRRLQQTVDGVAEVISREGPFVAVHSHMNFGSAWVLRAARKAGVDRRIAHAHIAGSWRRKAPARLLREFRRRLILSSATDLVGCAADAGKFVFGSKRFAKEGSLVRNAVDLDTFHPGASGGDLSVEFLKPEWRQSLNLLSVASMQRQKNHPFLIELSAALRTAGVDFHMHFVGDGPLRASLEEEVAERRLHDVVHFYGVRADIPDLLRACDLFLMPSFYEGLPVVLVEAQATGLPVIVSDRVAAEADMGLGLLSFLPIEDVSLWVEAIQRFEPWRPAVEAIHIALESKGYTVEASLAKLLPLYTPTKSVSPK